MYFLATYLSIGRWAGRPVEALLDVGLLARDARLEDREVGRGRGRELLGEVLGEVAGEAGLAESVGQVAIARLTDVWNRRTRDRSPVSSSTLTSKPAVCPSRAPP